MGCPAARSVPSAEPAIIPKNCDRRPSLMSDTPLHVHFSVQSYNSGKSLSDRNWHFAVCLLPYGEAAITPGDGNKYPLPCWILSAGRPAVYLLPAHMTQHALHMIRDSGTLRWETWLGAVKWNFWLVQPFDYSQSLAYRKSIILQSKLIFPFWITIGTTDRITMVLFLPCDLEQQPDLVGKKKKTQKETCEDIWNFCSSVVDAIICSTYSCQF